MSSAIANRVLLTLDHTSLYPHVSATNITGMACVNRGTDTVTIYVGELNKIKITIRENETYSGDFHPFKMITASGSDFELELRG